MSASASRRWLKAGLPGLMLFALIAGLVLPTGFAAAESLKIEVAKAEAMMDKRTKEAVLSVTLNESSAKEFSEFTGKYVGRTIILRFEGRILVSPVIRDPIVSGVLHISGSITTNEAKSISTKLMSGAKIDVELVE